MANLEVRIIEKTYQDPDDKIKMGGYLVRTSFYQTLIHREDDIKNTGYDWRPDLMKRNLSAYLQSNPTVSDMVERYRMLMVYLVDRVQDIKKAMNYTVDKHYKYIS
jgi:hypothetical protein